MRLRRGRCLAATVVVAVMAGVGLSEAQPGKKIPRVGLMLGQGPGLGAEQALRQGFHDLGYREGENIVLEFRFASGDNARFAEIAAELVRLNVDVIVAPAPPAALAARKATTTIPIVFAVVGDPVRNGLVASLARPGGNATGLTAFGSDLGGKRLEILKEIVPRLTKVAVLWNQDPARALRLQLQSLEVRAPADFASALDAMKNAGAQALVVLGEPSTFGRRSEILAAAVKARLPTSWAWDEMVDAGGLVAFGPNIYANNRRTAVYVDKILKGARPGDLPVEQPVKLDFAINLKARGRSA